MNKLLCVGDLHMKDTLSYNDYIEGGRQQEEKEVLDFIISQSIDCDKVILLGDNFNSKTNSAETIRKFTEFIERFDGKELFILKGNHESKEINKSAIDYLREIKNKKWHIITNKVEKFGDLVFCPYFTKQELETKDNGEASKKLMKLFPEKNILFAHHSFTDSISNSGTPTSLFDEIILDRKKLEKKYKLLVGGHIHRSQKIGNTIVAGSIFSYEVNEGDKFIWKINESTLEIEQIKLPGRKIYGVENPTIEELEKLPANSIVKVTITNKDTKKEIDKIKEILETFDAHMLIENLPSERKKIKSIEKGQMLDFGIDNLLELYSKEKNIPINKLIFAFNLIK